MMSISFTFCGECLNQEAQGPQHSSEKTAIINQIQKYLYSLPFFLFGTFFNVDSPIKILYDFPLHLYSYVKLVALWPYPTPRNHDLN